MKQDGPNGVAPVLQQGFTLIEILVAISILAIALVVVLQLFSGALKSGRISDEYTRGIFYAKEKMDEALLSDPLTPGVKQGQIDDTYQWRVEVVRKQRPEEEASKLPFDMFQIIVQVSWGSGMEDNGKRFQLSTIKIVRKAEEAFEDE